MGAPTGLIAGAIGSVFRQEASKAYTLTGNCRAVYVKTSKKLLVISILPYSILILTAPSLFAWVFGDAWRVAGEYARIMTPMFFLQFITNPISQTVIISGRPHVDLAWQCALLFTVVFVFWSGYFCEGPKIMLYGFSAVYVLMYLISFSLNYRFSASMNLVTK